MDSSTVILLCGTSASGKSTTAKALQKRLDRPFLALELDMFIESLSGNPVDHPAAVFEKMEVGYHRAVEAAASAGNDVISDHYRSDIDGDLLREHETILVGIHCPLEVLEAREASRPPERQGFARRQFDEFHAGNEYDVEVDTAESSPAECAERIANHYEQR